MSEAKAKKRRMKSPEKRIASLTAKLEECKVEYRKERDKERPHVKGTGGTEKQKAAAARARMAKAAKLAALSPEEKKARQAAINKKRIDTLKAKGTYVGKK